MAGAEIEWLSQTDCAARLARDGDFVSQQKISRYLARYPEIPRQDAGPRQPMLVDYAALKRHRSENIRVQERREDEDDDAPPANAAEPSPPGAETGAIDAATAALDEAAAVFGVDRGEAAAVAPPIDASARTAAAKADDASDLRRRERLAAAERAEFELAKVRGELIPRAIVVKAIRAAGVALHQGAKASRMDRAEEIGRAVDDRERVQIIERHDGALFTEFSRRVLALGSDDAADEEEFAGDADETEADAGK